jgi:hypothetical protein
MPYEHDLMEQSSGGLELQLDNSLRVLFLMMVRM